LNASVISAAPLEGIDPSQYPRHIAFIMDGNGRWAQSRDLPRIEGHRRGAATVRRIVEECSRLGLAQMTLYCLSHENWKRPPEELAFLMDLLAQFMVEERSNLMEQNVRVRVIGRRERIPESALAQMDKTVALCDANDGLTLCLAINYGGRQEIVDAVRTLAEEVQGGELDPASIDEAAISDRLYTAGMPDPDLMIRTSGELRISNYLLWQLSYAEIWVTDACWPEFEVTHLHRAIADYAQRNRRFGGLTAPEGIA
jgi:undecaprenyl diphosphate synthase